MSENKIIIKKIKKNHQQHHGGNWKVAYADFITSMMAFFLLLWLLSMTSVEKRIKLATYYKTFSVFKESGTSFMENKSFILNEAGEGKKISPDEEGDKTGLKANDDHLKNVLIKSINKNLKGFEEQILIDTTDEGLRIQMLDKKGSDMFALGGSILNQKAKKVLKVVAQNILYLDNKIVVAGHTDSLSYKNKKGGYNNWELSTDRASAARKELEKNGIAENRIAKVIGYADTQLLIKEDPTHPSNRRISIIILH